MGRKRSPLVITPLEKISGQLATGGSVTGRQRERELEGRNVGLFSTIRGLFSTTVQTPTARDGAQSATATNSSRALVKSDTCAHVLEMGS